MRVVQPAPTERTAETDQLVKYTESSTRQRAALLLCLCSLVHVCEGLVLPATFGWSSSRAAPRVQRTWLSVTRTKSPTKAEFECPLYDPPRMTKASGEVRTTTIISECEVSNDDAEDNHDERQGDENVEEYQDESEETEDIQMKKRTAAAAAALLRRNQVRRRSNKPLKSTSVGTRRVGSASRARNSEGRASKVVNAVRTVAAASAASERTNTTAEAPQQRRNSTQNKNMGGNVIQSTISTIMERQNALRKKLDEDGTSMSMSSYGRPMGLLGQRPDPLSHELLHNPKPGTMLLHPTVDAKYLTRPTPESLSVRVATPDDDYQIANLRLSVFSDFSTELRKEFCARSCQVLSDRRLRGATCLVATGPTSDGYKQARSDNVLGSVELSVHEFFATKLGQRRPKYSILYMTEVAVCPSVRRCGIGSKLLQVCSMFPPQSLGQ